MGVWWLLGWAIYGRCFVLLLLYLFLSAHPPMQPAGGWPVLVDRLAPRPRWKLVVAPGPTPAAVAAAASAAAARRPPNPPRVRAAAALVLGTAVKNIGSFSSWVLESAVADVSVAKDASAAILAATAEKSTAAAASRSARRLYPSAEVPANATVVAALVGLLGGQTAAAEVGPQTAAHLLSLRRRGVYALGAALRNNPPAQVGPRTQAPGTDVAHIQKQCQTPRCRCLVFFVCHWNTASKHTPAMTFDYFNA
jgi:hypothetical protein